MARFIESFCRITAGRNAGQLIQLRPWQRDILDGIFALDDRGRRKHRRGLLGLARKNGKSALGAGIALYGLVADGEEGAEVYSCAADREQARIVHGMAKRMVEMDPELSRLVKVFRYELVVPSTGSRYRALSAEAFTKEGLSPSLVVFDEVHAQPNDELWNVMTLGSGARERPLCLGITTAGVRTDSSGQDSLCYRLYQYGKRIETGEIEDPAFWFRWFEPADPNADHRDPKTWAEANPALNDFLSREDFEAAVRSTPEAAFRTKRCNQWVSSASSWLPFGAWELCRSDRRLEDGETIVLALDGSYSGDSTALVACSFTDPKHLEVVGHWEAPPGDRHWRVDIADVEEAVRAACIRWRVLEVAADPFRWQRSLQQLEADGVPVVEFPQSPQRMSPATQRFYDATVNRQLTHDGHPAMARHLANAVLKVDARGQRIVKDAKSSQRRIDLAVSGIMALDRAANVVVPTSRDCLIW